MNITFIGMLTSVVLFFVLGMIWYGLIFGKVWKKETKRTKKEKTGSGMILVALFLGLVMSLGANFIVGLAGETTFLGGMLAGLIPGSLIAAPVIMGEWIWDKKSVKLVVINTIFYEIYFVLISGFLAVLNQL